jgi:hypothetical protein
MMFKKVHKVLTLSSVLTLVMACGADAPVKDARVSDSNTEPTGNNPSGMENENSGNMNSGNEDPNTMGTGNTGNTGTGELGPSDPDPNAQVSLVSGDIEECLPGFLGGGEMGAYSGFAGSSNGAYFIWKDQWQDSFANLRVETWDAFGGMTSPGTHTITEKETNYVDCGLCVFIEVGTGDEYWPMLGSTVEFTSLATGRAGMGQVLSGTFRGRFTNGECEASAEISFSGVARDMEHGPL